MIFFIPFAYVIFLYALFFFLNRKLAEAVFSKMHGSHLNFFFFKFKLLYCKISLEMVAVQLNIF